VKLTIDGKNASGEIALDVKPGTRAEAIEKMLLAELNDALNQAADEMEAVLATYPSRYARPVPGKDAEGKTRYQVRARKEGGSLVPGFTKVR
jgi:hypothetical protein